MHRNRRLLSSLKASRLLATLPSSTTRPLSLSTQNRCHRSPRSNPIIVLSCLLSCCSLVRLRVYQTLSRQALSAFSSNLVRCLVRHESGLNILWPLVKYRAGLGNDEWIVSPAHELGYHHLVSRIGASELCPRRPVLTKPCLSAAHRVPRS